VSVAASNSKGELIALCRTQNLGDPSFESVSDGPGHAPWFRTTVRLGERELGHGEGRSKRDAERAASAEALLALTPSSEKATAKKSVAQPANQESAKARWPIYAEVLSRALLVAHERNEDGPPAEVAQGAAELYRALLTELGYIPDHP
jgi:ribonuclease III